MGDLTFLPINSEETLLILMDRFIQMDKSYFKNHWNAENFSRYITGKFDLSIVCLDKERVVGYLFGSLYNWKNQNIAHVNRIVTSDEYRNLNIGSELLNHFEKKAILLGVKKATLEFDNSLNVKMFYTKNNYKLLKKTEIKSYLTAKAKLGKIELFLNGSCEIMKKNLLEI